MQRIQIRSKLSLATGLVAGVILGGTVASVHGETTGTGHGHQGHGTTHMDRMEEHRRGLKEQLEASYDEAIRAPESGEIERGRELYATYCGTCHGASGKGDGPAAVALDPRPADFTDPQHAGFYSDRARLEIIRSGSPGTAMAPFGSILDDTSLMAVFQYIRSLRPVE